jgi:hypothetical protein
MLLVYFGQLFMMFNTLNVFFSRTAGPIGTKFGIGWIWMHICEINILGIVAKQYEPMNLHQWFLLSNTIL